MNESTQVLFGQVMHFYMQKSMSVFKKYKLHPGQAILLGILKKNDGLSQKELAEKLGVKPPSITAMLKKLESEHDITKKIDEKDQRITRIYITEEGKNIAVQVDDDLKEMEKQAFSNMSEQEIMLLRRLLLQMRENLRGETERRDSRHGETI